MRRASTITLLIFILCVVAINNSERGSVPCVDQGTGECVCDVKTTGDKDCLCAPGKPCRCSAGARCLCGEATTCNCGLIDCYCGSAGSCKGTGDMFCDAQTRRGNSDCEWRPSSFAPSRTTPPSLYCVANATSYASLPVCLRDTIISTSCAAANACLNSTALILANHPEYVIVPAMIALNVIVVCTIVACMRPRHKFYSSMVIPPNPAVGNGMPDRIEDANTSYPAVGYAFVPYFFCIIPFLVNAYAYMLIPVGVSMAILQFFGRNRLEFEPSKNRVSYYKYFCGCIRFLHERDRLDNLTSNIKYAHLNRSRFVQSPQWAILIPRRDGQGPLALYLNDCACDCYPGDWRTETRDRIRYYLEDCLASIDTPSPPLFGSLPPSPPYPGPPTARDLPANTHDPDESVASQPLIGSAESGEAPPPAYEPTTAAPSLVASPSRRSAASARFCSACGVKQAAGSRFCSACGTTIHYD